MPLTCFAGFYGPYTPAVFSANAVFSPFCAAGGQIPVHGPKALRRAVRAILAYPGDAGGNPGHRNGQGSQRSPGQRGGLGWKRGNPGHRRRARPTPATFTRSGAGHQDGGGNPGHHRRARFPAFTRATAAGWAGNTATLATIDGQGRRQRRSPAPALETAAATLGHHRRARPTPATFTRSGAGHRRRRRQPWPPSTGPTPATFTRSGAGHRRRRRQPWPPSTGKIPSVHQGNGGGLGWKHGNPGHRSTGKADPAFTSNGGGLGRKQAGHRGQGRRQRCSPAPALATRTAAATLATIDGQDSQRSPGQRRRVGLETRQPWPPSTGKADASDIHPLRRWPPSTAAATLATIDGLGALDLILRASERSPGQRRRVGPHGNTATLATIDGQGRRQRCSPAPALATRTAAATLATIDGQDSQRSPGQRRRVGLETRQPWPPSTGKADASDIHPLRRWPPGRRRQPWPPKQARFRAFTRATAAGWAGNTATLATETGKADASDIHPLRRWPPETAAATLGHHRRARPTDVHPLRRWPPGRRRQPWPPKRARFPAFTRATRRVGSETRQPWPPETGKADASDIHPLRRWPIPETPAATLATETGKVPSVHQGNGGGLGWKHGNPGHRRRARPTPATFTRSGAGHQDAGGNPGHHRRSRFPAFTRATAAGWAGNTATLATGDGQGRRQRRSPAPALATIDGGGNPGHRNRPDSERSPGQRRRVGLETRQPWPPSTGKADASDVHPLRRWPPSTAAATLATETGQIPSVHQGNAAGWAENTATLATIDGQGRRQRRSPAPALATIDGGGNPGHRNRPDSERSPGQRRRGSAAQVRNPPIVRAYFATTQPLGRCCRVR